MITVTLNTDKCGMCFIGQYMFNHDQAGPIEIDEKTLSVEDRNKFLYNSRRGVLVIDNFNALMEVAKECPAASPSFTTPEEKPITVEKNKENNTILIREELELKKLLREKIPVICKKVQTMSIRDIRSLLELELATKNRKRLVATLMKSVNDHAAKVKSIVGENDVESNISIGKDWKFKDSISEVMDSDVEQIVLNPISED